MQRQGQGEEERVGGLACAWGLVCVGLGAGALHCRGPS